MKVNHYNYASALQEQSRKKEKFQLVCIANIQTGKVNRISKQKAQEKVSKFKINSTKQGEKWLYCPKNTWKQFKTNNPVQLITEVNEEKNSHFEIKGVYYSIINCYVGFGSIRHHKRVFAGLTNDNPSSTKRGGKKGCGYQYIYGKNFNKKFLSLAQLNLIKHEKNPEYQSKGINIIANVTRLIKPIKTIRYEK